MKTVLWKLIPWFLLAGLVLPPARALASGGVRSLPLEQAVQQSMTVFVVEQAEPFRHVARLLRQPKPHKGRDRGPLQIEYLSFTIKEVLSLSRGHYEIKKAEIEVTPPGKRRLLRPSDGKGRYRVDLPEKPGELLWLVDSQATLNNELSRMYVEKGVNKIPIYERLEGDVRPEDVVAGQPYLLLVRPASDYLCYQGVGGLGLLTLDKKDEVVRLLEAGAGRSRMPKPSPAPLPPPPP